MTLTTIDDRKRLTPTDGSHPRACKHACQLCLARVHSCASPTCKCQSIRVCMCKLLRVCVPLRICLLQEAAAKQRVGQVALEETGATTLPSSKRSERLLATLPPQPACPAVPEHKQKTRDTQRREALTRDPCPAECRLPASCCVDPRPPRTPSSWPSILLSYGV